MSRIEPREIHLKAVLLSLFFVVPRPVHALHYTYVGVDVCVCVCFFILENTDSLGPNLTRNFNITFGSDTKCIALFKMVKITSNTAPVYLKPDFNKTQNFN